MSMLTRLRHNWPPPDKQIAARPAPLPPALLGGQARPRPVDETIPIGVRSAAAWSWRLLLIAAGVAAVLYLISKLELVVVPAAIAMLLAGLLQPLAAWLHRHGVGRTLAAAISLLVGIGFVAGIITLVVNAISSGLGDLTQSVTDGVGQIRDWLVNGPLGLSQRQIDDAIASATDTLSTNRGTLTAGALATANTVGHLVTGFLLAMFTLFFFLRDGRGIWLWLVGLFPRSARHDLDGAGTCAWRTLVSYVRATGVVAFVDAVGIGTGLTLFRVPLALPLAALVFLGAFIPVVGSFLSGLVAVLVALVSNGLVTALFVLAIVVAVMQVEGHLLQPLLLGRAVKVHPLAVILAIAAGVFTAGIIGGLVAVPLVACVNVAWTYLVRGRYAIEEAPVSADVDADEADHESQPPASEVARSASS